MNSHTYEIHLTLSPVPEGERYALASLVAPLGFKLAKLLMARDTPSTIDTFITAHTKTYGNALVSLARGIEALRNAGHTVYRYKVERIELDSRDGDVYKGLGSGPFTHPAGGIHPSRAGASNIPRTGVIRDQRVYEQDLSFYGKQELDGTDLDV